MKPPPDSSCSPLRKVLAAARYFMQPPPDSSCSPFQILCAATYRYLVHPLPDISCSCMNYPEGAAKTIRQLHELYGGGCMNYPVQAAPTIRQLHELSVEGCSNFLGGAAPTICGELHQLSGGGRREKCCLRGLRGNILKKLKHI